mmetsp:Transcript_124972/g.314600  ORF Transcript_124972/g.314600 Transcript_124972/m.314600 type:complete len:302 (-) Transcript_124972:394-1299(-)
MQCGKGRKLASSTCSTMLHNSSPPISRYLANTLSRTREASMCSATSESQAAGTTGDGPLQARSRVAGLTKKASAKAPRAFSRCPLNSNVRINSALQFGGALFMSMYPTSSTRPSNTGSPISAQSSALTSRLASSSSSCSPTRPAAANVSVPASKGRRFRMHCMANKCESQDTFALKGLSVRFFHIVLTGWSALLMKPTSSSRLWCKRNSSQHTRRLPVASLGPSTKSPVSNCAANSSAARSVRCHIMVSRRKIRMNSSACASVSGHAVSSCCRGWLSTLTVVKGRRCSNNSAARREERERM